MLYQSLRLLSMLQDEDRRAIFPALAPCHVIVPKILVPTNVQTFAHASLKDGKRRMVLMAKFRSWEENCCEKDLDISSQDLMWNIIEANRLMRD